MLRRHLKNIFSDKASMVLRALLREPEKHWKTMDFNSLGVSFGLASMVLNRAESMGYVRRVRLGPGSFTQMTAQDNFMQDWIRQYSFEDNLHTYYYSSDDQFLSKCAEFLREQKIGFALTLFSATRLISPYVNDNREFIYLNIHPNQAKEVLSRLEVGLDLKQLKKGGNVCLAIPYYQSTVFSESRLINGLPVVSNLQLYLDLMGFPPHGPEEAIHLKAYLEKQNQGGPIAWPARA